MQQDMLEFEKYRYKQSNFKNETGKIHYIIKNMKDIIPDIQDCSTLLSHFERWQNSNRMIISKAKFYNFPNHYFQNILELNKNIL